MRRIQERFLRNLVVERGIAMNEALKENLFVTIICILNNIPVSIIETIESNNIWKQGLISIA